MIRVAYLVFPALALAATSGAALPHIQEGPIVPGRAVVIGGVTRGGRDPFPVDAVQKLIVTGQWRSPRVGDTVETPFGTRVFAAIETGLDGVFRHNSLRGGYASVAVTSGQARVMLLEARGHSMVYVNGEPRTGDPYGYGYVRLPVPLRRGENEMLFACGRGELGVKLTPLRSEIMLDCADATLPDLVRGEGGDPWGAVAVINGTHGVARSLELVAKAASGRMVRSRLPAIPALGVRKVGFRIPGARDVKAQETEIALTLRGKAEDRTDDLDTAMIKVRVRGVGETRKRTFISGIDGSVQYYAVVPPRPEPPDDLRDKGSWPWLTTVGTFRTGLEAAGILGLNAYGYAQMIEREARRRLPRPALTLTCHGAGVEAIGQAASYAPKRGMWIVAPTNRRPYGFDWEEWGRMDALEVLANAQAELGADPSRTYLTGHSMGGHGTWHLGVTFPNLFAAIGPSAGWISFQSYAGGVRFGEATPIQRVLRRATAQSDTLSLAANLKPLGVYILHGDKDDNVPVTEARAMAAKLKEFHTGFTLFEQPGAGHWWGAPSDPGTGCVDWPAMFDLFRRSTIPRADETRQVDFTTMNPGVSSTMRWLTILQQQKALEPSSASIRCDPVGKRFVGVTSNVAMLFLDTEAFDRGSVIALELDGWKGDVPTAEGGRGICLSRTTDGWRTVQPPSADQKLPGRSGPFKEAFSRSFILVYGTAGNDQENAWSIAKARYDAETFWYRGNGSPDTIADTDFEARRYRDRSVILYGNADTNRAWQALLGASPVVVRRGSVQLGKRSIEGADLACLFCRPKPGGDGAYVAVVGGTGPVGMKLTDRSPYFLSGTGYPDLLVWSPEALSSGAAGVRAAGFFGNDWSVDRGDFAFAP